MSTSADSNNTPIRTFEESPRISTPVLDKINDPERSRSCLSHGLASHSPIARRILVVTKEELGSPSTDEMDLATPLGSTTPQRDAAAVEFRALNEDYRQLSDEARLRQEDEDSIALARMLMAQEAMESYALSADYLRYNAGQYSQEDMLALQALLAEEEEEATDDAPDTDNYEMMLRLGESIGDVKTDRWKMVAKHHISDLPTYKFKSEMANGLGENDTRRKCQVCQCDYESQETIRTLPCGHCFHSECVDQWLGLNDCCAYCRKSILDDTDYGSK